MVIKINGVNSITEIDLVNSYAVNVVQFTIDKRGPDQVSPYSHNRTLTVNEALKLRKRLNKKIQVSILFPDYCSFDLHTQKDVLDLMHADLIECHSPFSIRPGLPDISGYIARLNSFGIPVSLFGEGAGYDTPFTFDLEELGEINLGYIQFDCESIVSSHVACFRSRKELGIGPDEPSDVLLDTVIHYFSQTRSLVSDNFDVHTIVEDVQRVKALGVTLSLKAEKPANVSETPFFNEISSDCFTVDEISNLLDRIKSSG